MNECFFKWFSSKLIDNNDDNWILRKCFREYLRNFFENVNKMKEKHARICSLEWFDFHSSNAVKIEFHYFFNDIFIIKLKERKKIFLTVHFFTSIQTINFKGLLGVFLIFTKKNQFHRQNIHWVARIYLMNEKVEWTKRKSKQNKYWHIYGSSSFFSGEKKNITMSTLWWWWWFDLRNIPGKKLFPNVM